MTIKDFLHNLIDEYGTAEFEYHEKPCGVEPETGNGNTKFYMWYGETSKEYSDADAMMTDKFFDGVSLIDILAEIDVWF